MNVFEVAIGDEEMASSVDIDIVDGGSVVLLVPITSDGRWWVDAHMPDALRFGMGVAVERGYLAPILKGMSDDGIVAV
jgi:hypothetical protein